MPLSVFKDAGSFYARLSPMLLADEAHHNLMIGILYEMAICPEKKTDDETHMLLFESGPNVGAALLTPRFPLILAKWPTEGMAALSKFVTEHRIGIKGVLGTTREVNRFSDAYRHRKSNLYPMKEREMYVYELDTRRFNTRTATGTARLARKEDAAVLLRFTAGFYDVARNPGFDPKKVVASALLENRLYVFETSRIVAMAAFVRDTPNAKALSMVYTEPASRQRGYAGALVAHLCEQAFRRGKTRCVLLADQSDPAANHLYQKLGFEIVSEMSELRFEDLPV